MVDEIFNVWRLEHSDWPPSSLLVDCNIGLSTAIYDHIWCHCFPGPSLVIGGFGRTLSRQLRHPGAACIYAFCKFFSQLFFFLPTSLHSLCILDWFKLPKRVCQAFFFQRSEQTNCMCSCHSNKMALKNVGFFCCAEQYRIEE